MDQIYLWCLTAIAGFLSVNTLWRLISERQRWQSDDLSDSDRAFAWRVVIFLVFPLLNFLDMKATMVGCQLLGGYVKSWSYGLFWYHCQPAGLTDSNAWMCVLFAGLAVQLALAVSLLPAFLFRPHPFLATVLSYWIAFTAVFNLLLDPLMTLAGMSSPRWQWLYASDNTNVTAVLAVHLGVLAFLALLLRLTPLTLWFIRLTRPSAWQELQAALLNYRANPQNQAVLCHLAISYQKAGLTNNAFKQLQLLSQQGKDSLYYLFLDAVLNYRQRQFGQALKSFKAGAQDATITDNLRADLLAAAACAAYAAGQTSTALDLSQQALEFSNDCVMARLVRVDVLLQRGQKDLAGQDIVLALRGGLLEDLESKIPLDASATLSQIDRLVKSRQLPTNPAVLPAGK